MPSSESDSSTIAPRGPPEKFGLALTQVYKKVHFNSKLVFVLYLMPTTSR